MAQFQVGEFLFDTSSGRLTGKDRGETALAPQPARLLEMLIEHYPEAVSREEIRDDIWSGVSVEFEQSLHHCVRQVRQALDDSASDPTYVRTIHRKGYQLIAPVGPARSIETVPAPTHFANEPSALKARLDYLVKSTIYWAIAAAAVVGVVIAVGRFTTWFDEPVRIAVMSFESESVSNSIAEELVAELSNHPEHLLEIVGPTTTGRFEGSPQDLSQLTEEYRIDFILNGRLTEGSPRERLLAEVIRASDGAHIWVHYIDIEDTSAVSTITDGLLQYLTEHPADEDG